MSSAEQHLQADFALVNKLLQEYPSIKLIATKGEPPEQYDIEYNLKGYKANSDGTILPANKHRVRITLPFGYPHFPPTVKPLSPIFHPDIDPDAIRIADFWKESRTLPELILHIGQMICGTFYSSDPFNQRAFDWYEDRKTWLPFDILEPYEGDDEEDFVPRREQQTGKSTATAGQTPVPTVAAAGPPAREEEIPLDFAVEEEPVQEAAEESVELGDLLDGEFSHAFDLELGDEPGGHGEAIDDLLTLPEEENIADIEPSAPGTAGSAVDLTGLQDEAPSLDLDLELMLEKPTGELQPEDLTGGEADDFSAAFDPAAEPAAPTEETITLEDIVGFRAEDLAGEGDLAKEEPAATDLPIPEDFAIDLGIDDAIQGLVEEKAIPEPVAEEGLLGGISLQLDEEQGKNFGTQADTIRPLIERKEIFTAKKILANLDDPRSVPDRDELELTIAAAISKAEEIYKKADMLEQKGELEKAGLMLDLVANIAIDYPGLDFARNRIRESMMAGGQQKPTVEEGKKTIAVPVAEAAAEKPAPKKIAVPKLRGKVPYKLLGMLLALCAIAGGGTALYLKDSASLAKARTEYSKGQQLAEKLDFKGAEKAFTDARRQLDSILLFSRSGKNDLSQAIDAVVNAQPFKEGLQGKVLVNEQYVTIEAAKAIDSFTQHADSAEQARKSGNIDQAIISYEKSLEYAEPAGFQDKAEDIQQQISALRLQQAIDLARKAEVDKEWQKAADSYQRALELSDILGKPEEYGDIAKLKAAATLRHELEEGKRAFTSAEWQKAVEMLQRAQKLIAEDPTLIAEAEQQEIGKLLANASVYQILASAKNAFAQQDWEGAIKEYDNAVALLREKETVLGREEVADSIGKIEKTVLMTRISREQSRIVGGAADSGSLAANLEHYRAIASLIEKSPLKNDPALQEIYKDAKARIATLEKDILVNSKVAYLKERYEAIFRENYPSAKSSELLNPQVTFAKREGNVLIFSMSCAERSQGRTFRLQLNYQFDLDKGVWSLYPGEL
jgi:ubiquitin-protein ligase